MSNAGLVAETSFSSPGCTENSPYTGTDTGAVGLANNVAASSVNDAISGNCGYGEAYFDQDYISGGTATEDTNAARYGHFELAVRHLDLHGLRRVIVERVHSATGALLGDRGRLGHCHQQPDEQRHAPVPRTDIIHLERLLGHDILQLHASAGLPAKRRDAIPPRWAARPLGAASPR